MASLSPVGREPSVIWETVPQFPWLGIKAAEALGWGQAGWVLVACQAGDTHGAGEGGIRLGAPELLQRALAKDRSWGWLWCSEAIPGLQGVTGAKIRSDGKGWQSHRAGGKRIKQQLASSARGGLAQPSADLLPPAPDPLGSGQSCGWSILRHIPLSTSPLHRPAEFQQPHCCLPVHPCACLLLGETTAFPVVQLGLHQPVSAWGHFGGSRNFKDAQTCLIFGFSLHHPAPKPGWLLGAGAFRTAGCW